VLNGWPIPLFHAAFGIASPALATQFRKTTDKQRTLPHTTRCFTVSSGPRSLKVSRRQKSLKKSLLSYYILLVPSNVENYRGIWQTRRRAPVHHVHHGQPGRRSSAVGYRLFLATTQRPSSGTSGPTRRWSPHAHSLPPKLDFRAGFSALSLSCHRFGWTVCHSGKGSFAWTIRMRWSVNSWCISGTYTFSIWQETQFFVPVGQGSPVRLAVFFPPGSVT